MSLHSSQTAGPPPATRRSTSLLLTLLAAAALVTIWSVVWVQIKNDRDEVMRGTTSNLTNIARSFREHSQGVLRNADEAVRVIKFHFERRGEGDFPLLNEYFTQGVIDTNFFNQAGMIDENGIYAFSNLPDHKPVNLADREHFRVHRDRYAYEMHVSKTVFGRASKRWSIQLTRRIDKKDGSFGGVAVVSLDPAYLVNFHSKIDLGANSFMSFLGVDGVVRTVRAGESSDISGMEKPLPLPAMVRSQNSGTFIASDLHDGIERLYAFERLRNQPLMVLVGMDMREVLANHDARRRVYLGFASLLSLLVLVLSGTAIYSLRRMARLNQELFKKTQEAALASHHKSEFVASISHELRTPLNGIIGYAEYIMHKAEQPMLQFPAKVIFESGGHLLSLINSLLDLNTVEANEMRLNPEPFDLRAETEALLMLHRPTLESKEITLDMQFSPEGTLPVVMDRLRYRQVLGNLVDNATKYSFNGGHIHLQVIADPDEDTVKVSVEDEGIGIPPEHHGFVFDRFWRNEDFATRNYPGSGLGLALCQRLVELMGGTIAFTSEPDKGSTFFFTLPMANALNHDPHPTPDTAPAGR
jgi:two-component system, NarL family, sensor histidine kinase BarA